MNIVRFLNNRQLTAQKKIQPVESSLPKLKCQSSSIIPDLAFVGDQDPFMSMSYNGQGLLAVTSESGFVRVFKNECGQPLKQTTYWSTGDNAIFDAKWRPNYESNHIVTVSGNQSWCLWDIERFDSPLINQQLAHLSSVRCLSFRDANVIATGSRDGFISLWDIREASPVKQVPRLISIPEAHIPPSHLIGKGKGRGGSKSLVKFNSPLASVTCVLFRPETDYLYSAGASDGTIKLWDIRQIKGASFNHSRQAKLQKQPFRPAPLKIFSYQGSKSFSSGHGFTSLTFDKNGRIFASCTDHRVYCYDSFTGDIVASFGGLRTNNHTKISVISDFLFSGAVEGAVPVWSLDDIKSLDRRKREIKPIILLDHFEEVTAVDGDDKLVEFFACSDNHFVHKWTLFADLTDESIASNTPVVKFYETNDGQEVEIIDEDSLANVRDSGVRSRNSAPLVTLTDWLAQVDNQGILLPQSKGKKRPHSKENVDGDGDPVATHETASVLSKLRLTSSEPRKKKRRRPKVTFHPSTKKISDYFSP